MKESAHFCCRECWYGKVEEPNELCESCLDKQLLAESEELVSKHDKKAMNELIMRTKCLEIASKIKTFDGQPMTMKELLGKAEELFNFINQK